MDSTFLNQQYSRERDSVRAMASFIGIPLNSSYNEPGVDFGPDALRKASCRYANADNSDQPIMTFNPELRHLPHRGYSLRGITMVDTGNIDCGCDQDRTDRNIAHAVRTTLESRSFPVMVGGDHYLTFPVIAGFREELTVVQFDAHGDFLTEESHCPHGTVMRLVNRQPHVKRILHCGLRGYLNSGPGLEDSVKNGNVIITSEELRREGAEILLRHLSADEPVYISFDSDVLDPSIAPGVGVPEPGGIDYRLARELLCGVAQRADVRGIDFTEYNPLFDTANRITAIHLTNLIIDFLASNFVR